MYHYRFLQLTSIMKLLKLPGEAYIRLILLPMFRRSVLTVSLSKPRMAIVYALK